MAPNANRKNLESLTRELENCALLSPAPVVRSPRAIRCNSTAGNCSNESSADRMMSSPDNVNVAHPGMSGAGLRNNSRNGQEGSSYDFASIEIPESQRGVPLPAVSPLIPPPGSAVPPVHALLQHNVHGPKTGVTAHRNFDATFYRNPKNHPQHFQPALSPRPPAKTLTETVRAGAWTVGATDGTAQAEELSPRGLSSPQPMAEMMVVEGTPNPSSMTYALHAGQDSVSHKGKKRSSLSSSISSGLRSVGGSVSKHLGGNVSNVALHQFHVPAIVHAAASESDAAHHAFPSPNRFVSVYEDKLFHKPNTAAVEAVLAAACEGMGFEIAEMWLRTGPKTHQLIHSHVRPTALEERVAAELVEVYYGERSCERTHRLSPALCKRAKEAMDVVWVTSHTEHGADALKCSISDVRTAVAVPVCHEGSNTNITLIYFSIKRAIMRPPAVEFLVHMSLSAATVSVNSFATEIFDEEYTSNTFQPMHMDAMSVRNAGPALSSRSEHLSQTNHRHYKKLSPPIGRPVLGGFSVTGARLDMKWAHLSNVEYLTDGGNNWVHTAVVDGRPVVVKTLKPECQDVALAINELESELNIHSRLSHPNIVQLIGAGVTSKGNRFVVLERLDGGTLAQVLGYDTRIRDRRRRFWKKKHFSYGEVLMHARCLADALAYCQARAIPGGMVLHRDLKPDNVGFTLDGTVKLMDFGLSRIVDNASPFSEETYHMSGETGSLRYMAPEVASTRPYNHKADVYSFGVILWELITRKKPYEGMNRQLFYQRVVNGGERPPLIKKWPKDLQSLLTECWSPIISQRPNFEQIVERLDVMLRQERGNPFGFSSNVSTDASQTSKKSKSISSLIDRHSTWF